MSNCKEYGLPRRFAPRNDRGRRHCAPRPRLPRQKRGTLQSYPGAHTPAKPVIANQCAHWCGNPFPCRETWQVGCCLGKFVYIFRICLRYRFLPCPTARSTDCRVASLLAMTGGGVIAPHAPASPGRNVVHCSRTRVRTHLPSLSLRTSAHTGAAIRFPAGKLGKLAAV